ncbi:hypothetical protein PPYR_04891 [Photinus pyralis]|uniref:DNA/RNA non-specific endonuclease domain-containing protein n=1 Tax=Photinus pyralis TaxID=7054 RepID=A0A5N4AZD5_PHOPY|nr:uncharacterized protein LOC116164351 [Photinus pyralis]KAB0802705.1 hypothetical protein PPYR_04891 [Photinus pyralis]
MFSLVLVLCLLAQSHAAVIPKATGCTIVIGKHLGNPQPVLALQNDATTASEAIILPHDKQGTIAFNKGDSIDIACPGAQVQLYGTSMKEDLVAATCNSGTNFKVNGKLIPFLNITCSRSPKSSARFTGKRCAKNMKEIQIGFQVKDRFIDHILTCYDEKSQNALYAVSYLSHNVAGSQVNFPRPSFQAASFYKTDQKVEYLYSRKGQASTVNEILGLNANDSSIIHPTSKIFLAVGHFAPKADFVFGSQQRLTFYFVNAAPQWQNINGGNWNTMEKNARKLSIERKLDLTVYTGTHGVMTLPDVDGVEQKLYLWTGKKGQRGIPVPAFFYKVIYEPKSQLGIALVSRNDPHTKISKSDYICRDVCDKVKWLTWKQDNMDLGLVYCCEVDDFRKAVNVLPAFKVKSLLI